MKITFCTLHVRRSPQAVALAAGCLSVALSPDLRRNSVLLDFFPEQSDQEILAAIAESEPQIAAFPVYVWNRQRVIRLVNMLHRTAPGIALIAGGPEATGDPDGLAAAAPWTALVHGEGEAAFAGLVAALAAGRCHAPLPGVTLLLESGPMSGDRDCPFDLASASSPWLSGQLQPGPSGGVLWEVARGCTFACDYCFDGHGHAGIRTINRQRLAEELEQFVDWGVSQVWVLDATFNYPPERGIALLELLLEKAPDLHYHLEAKVDFIDRQTARLLGALNCSVQLGLQSAHQQVLRAMHRSLDLDILAEKVHLLNSEGVVYGFDLIYGLPEDNYQGFRASLDRVIELSPNHVHIFPLAVLPGTRLSHIRERYGIRAQAEPPYELIASRDWSEQDIELSRRLAAAVDLFYNTGRAVVFFPAILKALQIGPSALFEDFFQWAIQDKSIDYDRLMKSFEWSAEEVYHLLQEYLSLQLRGTQNDHLTSIFHDLLCYHFNYAETLLGEETVPLSDPQLLSGNLWESPWQRSGQCRLVPFAYEILDLLEMEEMQPQEIASLFRPVGSVALFLRRDNEVICESLSEEMLRLLKNSDGRQSPKEIFAGSLPQAAGLELVQFAVSEGLLQPAT